MKFVLFFRTALNSLLQHKLRSFLSVLGIICGVAAVFSIMAIGEGAKREVLGSIARLGLNNVIIKGFSSSSSSSEQGLDGKESPAVSALGEVDRERLLAAIADIEDVALARELTAPLLLSDEELALSLLACSANYGKLLNLQLVTGRFLSESDVAGGRLVCVLGAKAFKEIGKDGRLGSMLQIGELLFQVVGVLQDSGTGRKIKAIAGARDIASTIFIPFGSHHYLLPSTIKNSDAKVHELLVRIRDADRVELNVPLIMRVLEVSHDGDRDVQAIVPRELLRQSRKTQRIFSLVLGFIGGISLFVGGIGIMNVMLATVSERTREVGIRRAVGATRKQITAQFLAESIILTSVGGLLGLGAGLICALVISSFAGWPTGVSLPALILPLLMSVAVGGFFGLYPAVKASKMDPVRALRYI